MLLDGMGIVEGDEGGVGVGVDGDVGGVVGIINRGKGMIWMNICTQMGQDGEGVHGHGE